MEKQTVFIKRYIDKGEFPKEGWVLTPSGAWMFHGCKFRCPHDGTIQQGINEWLEEIELPSEDDLNEKSDLKKGSSMWFHSQGFAHGANFILNKLKGDSI